MNKNLKLLTLGLAILMAGLSCQRVPLTGRKQLVGLVSGEQMMALSFQQYKGFTDTVKVLNANNVNAQMVSRVGDRIKKSVEDYLIQNNLGHLLDGYQWEFRTVENKELNAWCMPGGKVCFYTGILPICQGESGVAVVMGHEVAHAIAEHGRERMSRAMLAQGFTQVGAIAAGVATGDERVMQTAGQVLGIGTQLGGVLPNSRKQESEADKLGLIFMAMAGYNPNEAVAFWQRMEEAGKNSQKPPQLLSTHPADATRIADLSKNMDKAMKYYYAYGNK
ncbi:M48 family metallopeptidase [Lacihabitans lacunae]|jgi:metalloendopeptidase OMA1, mitochondrial|uniref:M48 family metallopeptidase n=1 Tax=Lacihabitans lacunae TaxID=1028214 RepID=A0ABV7YSV1_9BACT